MRLHSVKIYACELPLKNPPYRMGGNAVDKLQSTVIRTVFDDELIAWGEACPLGSVYQEEHALGVQAALSYLCKKLVGKTFTSLAQWDGELNRLMVGHNAAKMALSIAFADALGKKTEQPFAAILGEPQSSKIASYYALGIADAEQSVRLAQEKVAQGFSRLQIKIGGRDLTTDVNVVKAIATAIPNTVELVADANRSLTMADALHFSRQCQDLKLVIEQPCATLEEHRQIAQRLYHPLFLDESCSGLQRTTDIVKQSLVSGFGVKLTRFSGLTDFVKLRDLCEEKKLKMTCDDSFGGDIIAAACIHAGSTIKPSLFCGSWIALPLINHRYTSTHTIRIDKGQLSVPKGAGLAIKPNEALLGSRIFSLSI